MPTVLKEATFKDLFTRSRLDSTIPSARAESIAGVATCYERGFGTLRNDKEALEWYLEAGSLGSRTARFNVLWKSRVYPSRWSLGLETEELCDWIIGTFGDLCKSTHADHACTLEEDLKRSFKTLPDTTRMSVLWKSFEEFYLYEWEFDEVEDFDSPAFNAAKSGDAQTLIALLSKTARPCILDEKIKGLNLLHVAALANQYEIIKGKLLPFILDQ